MNSIKKWKKREKLIAYKDKENGTENIVNAMVILQKQEGPLPMIWFGSRDWWHYIDSRRVLNIDYLYNWVSEKSSTGLPSRSELAWESKERRLAWVFNCIEDVKTDRKFPQMWTDLNGLNLLPIPKERAPRLSYQLAHMWDTRI